MLGPGSDMGIFAGFAADMRTYGGYIGFHPGMEGEGWTFGEERPLLSSGRACLAKILRHNGARRLHLPDHICDSVVLPLTGLGIDAVFYSIDEQLCPAKLPDVHEGDMLLLVDYFGVRSREVAHIAALHGPRAIVDRSQAFASEEVRGSWWFDSLRKFFPLPDGARVGGPTALPPPGPRNTRTSAEHLGVAQAEGLAAYRRNNAAMSSADERMSLDGEGILARLDVQGAVAARVRNFHVLHTELGASNALAIDLSHVTSPLYYPWLQERSGLFPKLHAAGIFAPRLWPEVLSRPQSGPMAQHAAEQLIPLPIDQRYTEQDMHDLLCVLKALI